ncbi:MAG: hypothetical protein HQK50_18520 [Oligoflexia bacterium]|nr:hypothetical protein [Oligoflexia bacterium]
MLNNKNIVLGYVSPIGTDLKTFTRKLDQYLDQFVYDTIEISLSELLCLNYKKEFEGKSGYNLFYEKIDRGNKFREEHEDSSILAKMSIELISRINRGIKKDKKVCFLIRQLKRPEEVAVFRDQYKESFFLVGVTAKKSKRIEFLTRESNITEEQIQGLFTLDESPTSEKEKKYSQKMRETYENADVFFDVDDKLINISRFLNLIMNHPHISPTKEEQHMFMAYSYSLRSADLSRQVGAAIESKLGSIISLGFNDVPCAGGGQYWPGDRDMRDHVLSYDSNAKEINEICKKILNHNDLNSDFPLSYKEKKSLLRMVKLKNKKDIFSLFRKYLHRVLPDIIQKSGVGTLTEFGRMVHAEMSAITNAAREGISVHDGIIYCTTFPCHNCTKHIIAAGIKKVIYIEAYPKSFALELHNDSIAHDETNLNISEKVLFTPFYGIAPRMFNYFFSMRHSAGDEKIRKDKMHAASFFSKKATPRYFKNSNVTIENIISDKCSKIIDEYFKVIKRVLKHNSDLFANANKE